MRKKTLHPKPLGQLLLLSIIVSSCTCFENNPPPPPPTPTAQPVAKPTLAPPTATAAEEEPTATAAPATSPTTGELALPTDFPSDVKVMDGSTLAAVQKLGGGAHNVLFTTDSDAGKVFDYYKEDLKNKGHEVTQQYQTGEQSFLSFKKGDLVTNVIITKDPRNPKQRVVAIMYYQEQTTEDF